MSHRAYQSRERDVDEDIKTHITERVVYVGAWSVWTELRRHLAEGRTWENEPLSCCVDDITVVWVRVRLGQAAMSRIIQWTVRTVPNELPWKINNYAPWLGSILTQSIQEVSGTFPILHTVLIKSNWNVLSNLRHSLCFYPRHETNATLATRLIQNL